MRHSCVPWRRCSEALKELGEKEGEEQPDGEGGGGGGGDEGVHDQGGGSEGDGSDSDGSDSDGGDSDCALCSDVEVALVDAPEEPGKRLRIEKGSLIWGALVNRVWLWMDHHSPLTCAPRHRSTARHPAVHP